VGISTGDVLPFAIGIAISPIPIIAALLVLFTPAARQNGLAFLVGRITALAAITAIALLVARIAGADTDEEASDVVNWIKVAFGIVLLALALRQWQQRPSEDEEAALPAWMTAIDSFNPVRSFGAGVVVTAANPKDLILAGSGGATIGQSALSAGGTAVVVVLFIAVASISITLPVAAYLLGGDPVKKTFDGWKVWLTRHKSAVVAVLFLVFGVVLFSNGLRGLYA
jgi:threonine/homoserine/homoserine lactone efflux protein